MNKKIKFLVVGYGRIGQRHINHIQKRGELVGVVENNITRYNDAKNNLSKNVNVYSTFDEIVDFKFDLVSICTPNGFHYSHALFFIKRGINVLIEKPITLSSRDAIDLITIAEKNNSRVFAVKQNRFNPPVVFLKEMLEKKSIGKITDFQLNCYWNRNSEYYDKSEWKGTKDIDGGVLFTQFSHFIDLIIWLIGDLTVEYARIGQFSVNRNIEIEDTGVAILKSVEHGCFGTLNYSINLFKKNMEGSLLLIGEKGTIKVGGQYLNELEYFEVDGHQKPLIDKGNLPNNYGTYVGSMSNHDKVYDNILDVLNNNGSISTSGIEAIKTVQLIENIYEKSKV